MKLIAIFGFAAGFAGARASIEFNKQLILAALLAASAVCTILGFVLGKNGQPNPVVYLGLFFASVAISLFFFMTITI